MTTTPHGEPSVKLFAYTGRENGLMVVGSRAALRELAANLASALSGRSEGPVVETWPLKVAGALVERGPYRDSTDWQLSFHVEGPAPAEQAVPLLPSRMPFWLVATTSILAVFGLVGLVRLVLGLL